MSYTPPNKMDTVQLAFERVRELRLRLARAREDDERVLALELSDVEMLLMLAEYAQRVCLWETDK